MNALFWLSVGFVSAIMYAHTGHLVPFLMTLGAIPYGITRLIDVLTKEDYRNDL